jgi:energy-converting hydrogenase Eha subunit B
VAAAGIAAMGAVVGADVQAVGTGTLVAALVVFTTAAGTGTLVAALVVFTTAADTGADTGAGCDARAAAFDEAEVAVAGATTRAVIV